MTADRITKPPIPKKTENNSSVKSKVRKTRLTISNNASYNQSLDTILLPAHFNNILDMFVSLDVVVNKLIKQRTFIYIDRVSEVLMEMNNKNFDAKVFGQILRIFPESYSYEFDSPPLKITRHYKEKMKIIPNLNFGNKLDYTPKKLEKVFRLDQLMSRKMHLYDCLLSKVQEKHNEFLLKNNEMNFFSLDKKWHKNFNLETAVEPIEPISLDRNNLKPLSNQSSDKISKLSISRISNGNCSLSTSNTNRTSENVKPISKSPLSASNRPSVGNINNGKLSVTNLQTIDGKENENPIKSSTNHNLSTKTLNERKEIVPSKSPLSVFNRLSPGIINKKKTSMTNLSATDGKENKNPNKSSNNHNLSTKTLNERKEIVPSKSPLSVYNRLSSGIINKKKTSMTNLSATDGKENKSQIKSSNNQNKSPVILKGKLIAKTPLSDVDNSSDLKPTNQNVTTVAESPIGGSIQRKSSKLSVRFSIEEARQSKCDRKAFQSTNRIPLRKSAITPPKTTPRRPENLPLTPKSAASKPGRNQPRLSFVSNSNCGTPKNFLASLTVPNSPMMKTEFVLKQKLPAHLKVLYESFLQLEKLIYDNRRKCETTYLLSAIELLSNHRRFTESQLGRIIAVYPEAYSVKLQHVPSKTGIRSTNKIDIAIRPNLESSNFLKFDFATMKKREQKFLENCVQIVVSSYREFLIKNSINPENLEDHIRNGDWNNDFNIDLHVKTIEPVPMPQKSKQKELENSTLTFSIVKKKPAELDSKLSPLKTSDKLGSLSQSLIDKVRMNKARHSVISRAPATMKRNFMASKLPEIATIIANEFKMFHNKPLEKSQIVNIVCKSLQLNESSFNEYLNMLDEVVPGWIKHLNWAVPRVTIGTPDLSFDDVLARLNKNIVKQSVK